jgi:hypothetical protein
MMEQVCASDHSQSIPLQEELFLRVLSQLGGLASRGLWTELLRTTVAQTHSY